MKKTTTTRALAFITVGFIAVAGCSVDTPEEVTPSLAASAEQGTTGDGGALDITAENTPVPETPPTIVLDGPSGVESLLLWDRDGVALPLDCMQASTGFQHANNHRSATEVDRVIVYGSVIRLFEDVVAESTNEPLLAVMTDLIATDSNAAFEAAMDANADSLAEACNVSNGW